MTPQEQSLLQNLLTKLAQTPAPAIDPQADALIRQNLAARPDALYLLTQIAVMQNIALEQAQQQISDLQRRLPPQPQQSGSFLGGFGQFNPTGTVPPVVPPQSGSPSFLHNVMTTAAGVFAGEAAFSTLRSLFGGPSAHAAVPPGGFWGGESTAMPPQETIINNYYGDSAGSLEEDASDIDLGSSDSDFDI